MNTTLISAIMLACSMSEADAQQELKSSVSNLHSWLDKGIELYQQTGYGCTYIEEEMQNLGLDYDYMMPFAEEVLLTYEPSTEKLEYNALKALIEPIAKKFPRFHYYEDDETYDISFWFEVDYETDTQVLKEDIDMLKAELHDVGCTYEADSYTTMRGWKNFDLKVVKEKEQCA